MDWPAGAKARAFRAFFFVRYTVVRFFASEQNASLLYNEDGTPTARTNKILAATPMGRFGDSEKDLVGALLFLLNNDAAGFITGICLPIDGGFSAYSGV